IVKANEKMRFEITERKKTERALLQSQSKLQRYITAIDDIGLGLCVIDSDYHLRIMNNTMIGWFGDYHGSTCHSIIMGQDSPCQHCRLKEVVEEAKKIRYQPTMANDRRFDIVATPIANNDGTTSKMLIIRDITEQHQQEQRRLELSRQTEELKKLASLKNMAGAIAHRFNNAMVAVQGNLQLLTLYLPDSSKEHVMASRAFLAAKGASQIGSSMLSYVGQQPLTPREVSLVEVVREAVTALKHLFLSTINLEFKHSVCPFYCRIDRQQLKVVIENIVTNALESLKGDSGTIEITFGSDYFAKDQFPLYFQDTDLKNGMYSFCQIKDSGQGVSAEDLPKVFDPFYTTKFVGRGLGLALSAGVMQTHQGALTFDSNPESGTKVKILLPSLDSSSEQPSLVSGDSKVPSTKLSGNILLVDDESSVLDVGRKILTILGFNVDTAVNGREAVAKFSEPEIDYCAIVMDVAMPEMDGIEAMKVIRKSNPTIPILLSSGYSESELVFSKEQGSQPDVFLPKPFSISDLQNNLAKILSPC
ncbi:response regulator, partial [Desulfopila sp. IMCC35006]|uniref:hybrid sensor histidine kinase/response regulator n=2 Tax=Desulfopila sp. IMCC35006 TaxID=2569542 RepID=UPI00197AA1B9